MATAGEKGGPHIAPVHARLDGRRLRLVIYDNTLRRRDIAANPRVAFTTWRADGAAAIVYGVAREIEGSLRSARASAQRKAAPGGRARGQADAGLRDAPARAFAVVGRAPDPRARSLHYRPACGSDRAYEEDALALRRAGFCGRHSWRCPQNALCRSRTVAATSAGRTEKTAAQSCAPARRTVTASEFVVLDAAGKDARENRRE